MKGSVGAFPLGLLGEPSSVDGQDGLKMAAADLHPQSQSIPLAGWVLELPLVISN